MGGGAPGGGVLAEASKADAGGTGTTAPGRLAAASGCTSGGGLLTGCGSGGGGNVAPGRVAAFAGWTSAGGGFFGVGGLGGAGEVNVGTGANVVSGGGATSLPVAGVAQPSG